MFLHWKPAADHSHIILVLLCAVGRVVFSIALALQELGQDQVSLSSTTKTYGESSPAAPASRDSYRSCSLFQRPKPHYSLRVCGIWPVATQISTSYVWAWAPGVLFARTWVVNKDTEFWQEIQRQLFAYFQFKNIMHRLEQMKPMRGEAFQIFPV